MALPSNYTRVGDFSDDEASSVAGRSTVRTTILDSELDRIASIIADINTNLGYAVRSDGGIKDNFIKPQGFGLSDANGFIKYNTATNTWTFASDPTAIALQHSDDAKKYAINAEDSQFTTSDGTTGYSALHYNAKASASSTSASSSSSTASSKATEAENWATKVDGVVPSTSEYSAKEYSQGSQASTGGSAKNWASQTGSTVTGDGSGFSAKEHAEGSTVTGGSAKDWATKAEDSAVSGGEFSAKHWSAKSQGYADQAASGTGWFSETATVSYVSGTSFTVAGDVTGVYVANRRLNMTVGGSSVYSHITSSSYSAPNTTVNINDSVLTASLTAVKYSVVFSGTTGNINPHDHSDDENGGVIAQLDWLESSVVSNTVRILESDGLNMVHTTAGVVDEFNSSTDAETAIDASNSTNESYDASADTYSQVAGSAGQTTDTAYTTESNYTQQEWTTAIVGSSNATFTNSSTTVTISSGTWPANCDNGRISQDGTNWYDIASRDSATQLTLTSSFSQSTVTGTYTIRMTEFSGGKVQLNNNGTHNVINEPITVLPSFSSGLKDASAWSDLNSVAITDTPYDGSKTITANGNAVIKTSDATPATHTLETGNSSGLPAGVSCSASGGTCANLFDGTESSGSRWEDSGTKWIKVDFGSGNAKTSMRIKWWGWGDQSPKDYTFQGSNDDVSYTTLLTVTGNTTYNSHVTDDFSNSTAYRYYKMNITATVGGADQANFAQLYIYSSVAGATVSPKFGTGMAFVGRNSVADNNTSYLTASASSDWNFGTQDLAFDMWINSENNQGKEVLYDWKVDANNYIEWYINTSTGAIRFHAVESGSTVVDVNNTASGLTVATWYWIALSKTSGVYRMYLGGSQVGTDSTDTSSLPDMSSVACRIGGPNENNASGFMGWLDEARISVGTNRGWTGSTITVPSSAYETDSYTKMLIHCEEDTSKRKIVTSHKVTGYSNTARGLEDFTFQASNDGVSYTTLDTETGLTWTANEVKTFSFSNTTAYRYYKWNFTEAGSNALVVRELELFDADATDLASGGIVTATATSNDSQIPNLINDNTGDYWDSNLDSGFMQVDLTGNQFIDSSYDTFHYYCLVHCPSSVSDTAFKDENISFVVWTGSAWKKCIKYVASGTKFQRNTDTNATNAETWTDCTGAGASDVNHAISEAIENNTTLRMKEADVEGISDSDWNASGGWSSSVDKIGMAVTMKSESTSGNATTDLIQFNYDGANTALDLRTKQWDGSAGMPAAPSAVTTVYVFGVDNNATATWYYTTDGASYTEISSWDDTWDYASGKTARRKTISLPGGTGTDPRIKITTDLGGAIYTLSAIGLQVR